jgi:hypothetical protein
MSNKKEHFLYLVKTSELKLMTETEAARLALMDECDVWNVTTSLDMEPELLEEEVCTDIA